MTKEQEDALLDAPKPAKCYGVNPANTPRTDAATLPCGWDTTDPVVKKTFAQKLEQELSTTRDAFAALIYSAEEASKLIISVTDRYDIDAAIESAKAVMANKDSNEADASWAMQRNWWLNVYPDGKISSALCPTREDALNRSTYTGETPDAQQVEVRLHIVRLANDQVQQRGEETT